MKNLLFVARVAFIANGCMLLSILMRYVELIRDKDLQSTIIIAGFLLSVLFNIMMTIGVIIFLLRKLPQRIRPLWLFGFNFVCFIFQIYFLSK